MKKFLLLLALSVLGCNVAFAQIPDGSIAPDFTATDINGNTYNLYDLLDQGKVVYLDIFATWCGPCWAYKNTGALEGIWNQYGPPGTDEAFVFAIEGDPSTNVACLYGPSGCVGGTQGDWTAGTDHPIVDDAGIAGAYQITYYPTIFCICPTTKKVYECGQLSTNGLWNYQQSVCPPPALAVELNTVTSVKCYGTNTGAVDISISGGQAPYTYNWSNGLHTQDLNNVPAGTYTCSITSSNGLSIVTDPIDVPGPASALSLAVTDMTPVGCNGILGSITVQASGGWDANYTYAWQNGQFGETAINLAAGNYTVSVTDDNACTKTLTATLAPAVLPTAAIAAPPTVTCAAPTIQLDGTGSSQGDEFNYQWFASSGGNITSGSTTTTPSVNAAGSYTIQVTNIETTCKSYATVSVSANTTPPTANAGPSMTVSCGQPSVVLQGSGSGGSGFSYLWTASNGGNIVSGAGTLTPTVNAAGTYTLKVTNSANGCTQTAATTVTGNNTPPTAAATGGALNCSISSVTLSSSTNASNPGFTWTGPNGFSSTLQNPSTNAEGTYTVTIADAASGCTSTATAVVATNTTAPGATATGGTLTCVVNSVTLNGATNGSAVGYAWTGPNGFSSNVQNPSVTSSGDYVLTVLDSMNGCTSTATAAVALNNIPPVSSAVTPGNLNCNAAQLQLNGTGSSQGADFSYAWTTTGGNIVSGENTMTPLVDAAGTYNLLVTNTANGCTSTTATTVVQSPAVVAGIAAQTNVSCFNESNGSATASAAGGNGAFSYAWSNGASTASVSGLVNGTYVVVVTDGENCTSSAAVVITQPDVLAANASATAQSANGVNDGTATANPTGGTAGFTYAWSEGSTTQTITGLAPGNYTVSVTDANGCISIQTITVNSFNCALSASISGTNVTCNGAANGTATVALVGAADPVTYAWSNGASTSSVSGLAPGDFIVSMTDANNCPASLNIVIAEPPQLLANAISTPESAAGANDGTASANPTGGTAGYTYLWSNNETTQNIGNLAPGTYTVSVTDANGCVSVQTVNVSSFDCAISAQITASNVTCFGLSNGAATAVPVGGTAPFTYVWSNGIQTATASDLVAGTYSVSVTDDNGCLTLQTVEITEPQVLQISTVNVNNVVCANDPSGSAEVLANGGTTGYTYLWSNGATGPVATGLVAGNYNVVVTDANSCSQERSVTITANDDVAPSISVQNATLALGADGIVEVTLQNLGASVTDNCSNANVVISPAEFDCDQLGDHEITVTAIDEAGNSAFALTTVTIIDNLSPVLTCPASVTRCLEDNIVSYALPVAVDNCLSNNGGGWELLAGLSSGSEFPVGVTTQTYAYTDPSGNTGTCSFDVIILAPANVAVTTVLNDKNGQGVGSIDITVTGGTEPYVYAWTKDGVPFASTEDLENLNSGVYAVQVTDANGCVVSSGSVEVSNTVGTAEPEWLRGVQLRPNPTSGITRIVFSSVPDKSLDIAISDATGRIVLTQSADQQTKVELDCSALPDGMYFVQFRTGQEVGVRRLVVNR